MQLQFRVLGPLEVEAAPSLGGPKQRALLALLLDAAGTAVAAERLVDGVWGEDPPETAEHALQVYVSQLRKAIAATGAQILRRGRGYELVLGDARIDAHEFERLAREGRELLQSGDASAARERLASALALWRGPALVDVDGAGAALDEARLAAQEDLTEAELAIGRHDALVPELERRVREQPLRERTRRQLVVALYRAGRQADALAAHRDARDALDEIGLEPSPELRALETAILRQDASLEVEPEVLRLRRHLPAPVTPLVGRDGEAREVGALLRGDARLVTLTGPGGTGKTRLGLRAAHEVAEAYPGGVWFVALAPLRDPALVLPTIAQTLGTREADLVEALQTNAALLLLDNFEQVVDAAPRVGELLQAAPQLRVLVTSRAPLRIYGEHEFAVAPLPPDDAKRLFVERARAAGRALAADERVERICARLDGLPLAVELVAARTRDLDLAEIVSSLDRALDLAVDGPRDVPDRQRTLRGAIGWSHDLLADDVQRLFACLGVFAGGFTSEAAEVVCGADAGALTVLLDASLLQRSGTRFEMLETVRDFAAEQLCLLPDRADVHAAHARHFLSLAEEAGDALWRPTQDARTEWLDRLEMDVDNLRAMLGWAERHDKLTQLRAVTALLDFWVERAQGREGMEWAERALEAAPEAPDALRAKALHAASGLAFSSDDPDRGDALGRAALALYRELGDREGEGRTLFYLAHAAGLSNRWERAAELAAQSLALARALDHTRGITVSLTGLAAAVTEHGDTVQAEQLLAEAVALATETGDDGAVAGALRGRGDVARVRGAVDVAAYAYADALRLYIAIGNSGSAATTINRIAALSASAGDAAAAARLLGAAAAVLAPFAARPDASAQAATAAARTVLGEDEFAAAFSAGGALSLEQAAEEALAAASRLSARGNVTA